MEQPPDTASTLTNGMEKPKALKLSQPLALKVQAAMVIAKAIDPSVSMTNALHTFNNSHKIASSIDSLISHALLERNRPTIHALLRSQNPLRLQIRRFEEHPENLYPLTTSGLYVRSKIDGYNPDCPDPLYAGIAQLIPDPLTQNAPLQFFQVYSNPNGTKYFDDNETQDGRNASSAGICIWDKKSGARLNDGKAIRAKLLAKHPQIANLNSELHNFFLYGISSDEEIAWCRFVYNSADNTVQEGVCAFRVNDDEIIRVSLDACLCSPLSYSGKLCAVYNNNSITLVDSNTGLNPLPLSIQYSVRSVSPKDDYAIIENKNIPGTSILNLETKELTQLTLNNNQFNLANGRYNPLSRDGSLIAVLENNQIYILKVHTNELVCTVPAPNNEDNDTYYNLLFSPDSTQILTLKITLAASNNYDDTYYHLTIFDIATQQPVEILDASHIENGDYKDDFIFCNQGDYLLLPNGQFRIQPQGLVRHLSLQGLIGLLILEEQKKQQQPIDATIIQYLQKNQPPKIQELIACRYATPKQ
jgi:hypothetical protein